MILTHRIHVLTKKEELDTVRLAGKIVVVLDVLFATSTMVTALEKGARDVVPALDGAAARAAAEREPAGTFVVAGELNTITLEGFAPPTPLALVEHGVAGRRLIYSTTNGTVALHGCSSAPYVYCGALLNARALTDHILRMHADSTVLIVCAGSVNNFNMEDFVGAGCFVDLFATRLGEQADFSDAARAARAVYRSGDPSETMLQSRVGRLMVERQMDHELRFCARESQFDVVARYADGVLRRVEPPR